MSAHLDVAVIGGGPAGLSAAIELKRQGIARVGLFERESEAGGIPRHCAHPPFGLREFGRLLTGPGYARRLVALARTEDVEIHCNNSIVGFEYQNSGVKLLITTPAGLAHITARRVLLATGTRETTRAGRLLPGERPLGVINTGALQAYAHMERRLPFERPVIVGTELVSLSAILTCRSMGAYPVAMIGEEAEVLARKPLFLYPRLLGLPVLTGTRIVDIEGNPRVSAVTVEGPDGSHRRIACDGIVLSGRFTPESSLARLAGLGIDPKTGGPIIDNFGRTTHPCIFAAGNLLRPVETAGWCYREGRLIARQILRDLQEGLPDASQLGEIQVGEGIRYAAPQRVASPSGGMDCLQLRLERPFDGWLTARDATGRLLAREKIRSRPERRILLPLPASGPENLIRLSLEDRA